MASQKPTRRVLEIETHEQGIFAWVIRIGHIGLIPQGLRDLLSKGTRIVPLNIVTIEEGEISFWLAALHHLLALAEDKSSLHLLRW